MDSRELLRRQLDVRLRKLPRTQPPAGGWIRTIRKALGMTMAQLGKRLGVSAPAVAELESRENRESISLGKLRNAADAMGCDLLIAFVPRVPLTEMVKRQATVKALEERGRLLHTMKLENQAEGVESAGDTDRSVEKWMAKRSARIWD
jgi:predicted DNA-binding mobile mystery protein A